jgi:hypothetical protein
LALEQLDRPLASATAEGGRNPVLNGFFSAPELSFQTDELRFLERIELVISSSLLARMAEVELIGCSFGKPIETFN